MSITFSIYGIHCSQCLKKIKGLTRTIPGLTDIVVDMSRQTLKVEATSEFRAPLFVQATKNLGFEAREISVDEKQSLSAKKSKNSLLAKVGVAGALAGNIMLLSYAVYLGAPVHFSWLFGIISGALFLPVLLYSASPFYKTTWVALKNKKPSIDLPLALAIVVGSGLSYYNLLIGSEAVYFDSLAALVFLLLSSRYIVQRFQEKYLSPVSLQDIFPSYNFIKVKGLEKIEIPGSAVAKGDLIIVSQGQILPADGILTSESGEFDNSLITGESESVTVKRWSQVYGGVRCLSKSIMMEIEFPQIDSRISKILEKLNKTLSKDSSIVELTDSFANYFTVAVFWSGFSIFCNIFLCEFSGGHK